MHMEKTTGKISAVNFVYFYIKTEHPLKGALFTVSH